MGRGVAAARVRHDRGVPVQVGHRHRLRLVQAGRGQDAGLAPSWARESGWHTPPGATEPEPGPKSGERAIVNRVARQIAADALLDERLALAVVERDDLAAGLGHGPARVDAAGCGTSYDARGSGDNLHTRVAAPHHGNQMTCITTGWQHDPRIEVVAVPAKPAEPIGVVVPAIPGGLDARDQARQAEQHQDREPPEHVPSLSRIGAIVSCMTHSGGAPRKRRCRLSGCISDT